VSSVHRQETRLVIAGGGTGGHVFPALAIRQALARLAPDVRVVFVGTRHGLEATVLPQHGEIVRWLWISGFSRRSWWKNFLMPVKLAVSLAQSLRLLLAFRPQVVIGTGGYVMGPVLWTAQMLGIPTLIQEQNSRPGYTTRKLAKRARVVCAAFEEVKSHLPSAKVQVTGNPLRASFAIEDRARAQQRWNLDWSRRTVLVFGGSAGARSINEALAPALSDLLASFNVIWQTGKLGVPAAADQAVMDAAMRDKHLLVHSFIEDMAGAYAVSDIAVCRAGAMTLAELATAGLRAVLIPYPFATDDHQTANARVAAERGAAVLIADGDLTAQRLVKEVHECLTSDERRAAMSAKMKALARPQAADDIARIALSLLPSR
jgi:UDP-N-acetylglucosamine--N-acetylmuramyl-(pentapeptide) pyrophosphoryl-undecaprenol N-acetylglucosamine transferase